MKLLTSLSAVGFAVAAGGAAQGAGGEVHLKPTPARPFIAA